MCINNPQGFKLPESLGYISVTRYKPKPGERVIDWKNSKALGTRVYHTNLNTFGYMARIGWYADVLAHCRNLNIYKFVPERPFSRGLAKAIKSGKIYNEQSYNTFKSRKIKLRKSKYNELQDN